MRPYLENFKTILRHKWYVFWACLAMDVPLWRALIHDLSKFSPQEFGPYARQFYDEEGHKKEGLRDETGSYDPSLQPDEFQLAWINHQRNKHHWQAWVSIGDEGKLSPVAMPETYLREMVADWIGAGITYSGKMDPQGWYEANGDKMILHPASRRLLEMILEDAPTYYPPALIVD